MTPEPKMKVDKRQRDGIMLSMLTSFLHSIRRPLGHRLYRLPQGRDVVSIRWPSFSLDSHEQTE